MKRKSTFSLKLYQKFVRFTAKLNLLLHKGAFFSMSLQLQRNMIQKLSRLYQRLKGNVSEAKLSKVLASAGVLLGIGAGQEAIGQTFNAPVANPFGLATSETIPFPHTADIDDDGDLDLIIGGYYGLMSFHENTGTKTNPVFGAGINPAFGLDTLDNEAFIDPTLVDIDDDGDLDLFAGMVYGQYYYGDIFFFENTGTKTNPVFGTPQLNPFGITKVYDIAFPEFADLDDDGDLDLMVGEYYGAFKYFQNTGTKSNPQFALPLTNPFGLDSSYSYYGVPAFVDLDMDGDLDLFTGEYYGAMSYYENVGTKSSPSFGTPVTNPFGLTQTYYLAFPHFADMDDDGDMDLFVGEAYGIQYFENTTVSTAINDDLIAGELNIYPNPASETLYLDLKANGTITSVQLSVMDAKGVLVKQIDQNLTGSLKGFPIDISSLSPGMYALHIQSGEKSEILKFVKQ